jgi:hypothetical protein
VALGAGVDGFVILAPTGVETRIVRQLTMKFSALFPKAQYRVQKSHHCIISQRVHFCDIFPSGFPTKTLYVFLMFLVRGHPSLFGHSNNIWWPIPVAARSKAWVYGRSLTGIVGSNPA